MIRPLDEFAGWLRFFHIIVFMNLALNLVFGITLFEDLVREPDKILTMGSLAQWGFTLFMFYSILKIIEKRDKLVPEKIKDSLFYIFIVAILQFLFYTTVTILVYKRAWNQDNTVAFVAAVQNMIWTAIWRTYFEKSKRVAAYYKDDKQDIDVLV